jgi:transposase
MYKASPAFVRSTTIEDIMQTQAFLGIDVSKQKLDICLLYNGQTSWKHVPNSQEGVESIAEWCEKLCPEKPHVCMEATSDYMEECAELLYEKGYPVSVVNPAQPKAFAQSKLIRVKTDKVDAKVIAEFCQAIKPDLWQPQSPECRELRDKVRSLDFLKLQRRQLMNKMGHRLHAAVQEILQAQLDSLNEAIANLEKMIEDQIKNSSELSEKANNLTEIVGIGKETVRQILVNMPSANSTPKCNTSLARD